MRRYLAAAAMFVILAGTGLAVADLGVKDGTGASVTMFDYLCFTTKHCSTVVPINSSGTEIATTANPLKVDSSTLATQATLATLATTAAGPIPAGSAVIGKVGIDQTTPGTTNGVQLIGSLPALGAGSAVVGKVGIDQTTAGVTNGVQIVGTLPALATGANTIGNVGVASQYPGTSVAVTATATGTTAATTATLAGVSGKTTYVCSLSIRSNATAAATGNATVTGTITATMNYTHWTAPLASGLGVTEMIFAPCVPASAANTAIAVVSPAPGAGGTVSVTATGYQL